MNGAHDLGGMHGFGPIDPDPNEPIFAHEWERRCFAITLAAAFTKRWNLDMSRHARERMKPDEYLSTGYYEHWLHGLETLLVESGLISVQEIEARMRGDLSRASPVPDAPAAMNADQVLAAFAQGSSVSVPTERSPRFRLGDRVRARNHHPIGHTRLPRYARGRCGIVRECRGAHIFADTNAQGLGKGEGEHLYNVEFTAEELWGEGAVARDVVRLDLWEPHLESV
ncbi:nitrile hydratase subunit beta [Thioalkalivibrio sp. HK1]|uniref:nitrile hydratase subunit beta n=1 Tax=Thioalkalivibrio sp. HK1 TaxID=1469245 RepID=UPI00046F446B|nr:nitrile hydratase subunit beta [Thioalkalivibrio sp. HK1]